MAANLAPTNAGGKKIERHKDARCLKCHAMGGEFDDEGHAAHVGGQFYLGDGVGCESCHGAAGDWVGVHYQDSFRRLSIEEKKAYGLKDTKSLKSCALICAGCHIGGAEREVDHDLIAAGHPRLSFEFSGYMALYTKHWPRAEDRERYPDYDARALLVGQAATAKCAMELLAVRAQRAEKDGGKKWPEFSEYACYACHKSLEVKSPTGPAPAWKASGRRAGSVPWGTWYFNLTPTLAANRTELTTDLAGLAELMRQPAPSPAEVAKKAGTAANALNQWLNTLDDWPAHPAKPLNRDEVAALFKTLVAKGEKAAPGSDWDDAAQLYLALAALGRELPANPKRHDELRKLAAFLRSAFPSGVDSPRSLESLTPPPLEERLKTLGGLVER